MRTNWRVGGGWKRLVVVDEKVGKSSLRTYQKIGCDLLTSEPNVILSWKRADKQLLWSDRTGEFFL